MSVYDPAIWDNKTPANVIGGRNRAATGERDALGRFLPRDEFLKALWQLDPNHGQPGGRAVVEKYGREHFGKIAKMRKVNGHKN